MHFSKTYAQLLLTLPSDLRNSAIEYRRLKKLIRELVAELESLGLSPLVLQELLQNDTEGQFQSGPASSRRKTPGQGQQWPMCSDKPDPEVEGDPQCLSLPAPRRLPSHTRILYELANPRESGDIVPQLRLWVEAPSFPCTPSTSKVVGEDLRLSVEVDLSTPFALPIALPTASRSTPPESQDVEVASIVQHDFTDNSEWTDDNIVVIPVTRHPHFDLLLGLHERSSNSWHATIDGEVKQPEDNLKTLEVVIPLTSDIAFFRSLANALNILSDSLSAYQRELISSVQALGTVIAATSRPASAGQQSDLYTWRTLFRIYMESEVFESFLERDRGERSVEDAESRLSHFARRVSEGGFSFRLAASPDGLKRFLELNVRLMEIKKFQAASTEAVRKILKKHAKRTALPLPTSISEVIPVLGSTISVPHVLVVAFTETLMPIIPQIDDYVCLICIAIAFKPIRLRCGHLFCVRCLVKMQKRGQDHCPLCRAPTVLSANKSNVDHALINFMLDWFPKETREKDKTNKKESAKEEMEGLDLDVRCTTM